MFTKKICAFAIVILTAIVCFGLSAVWAGTDDNVSGFAWSENIGWISFNSTSDGSPADYGVEIDLATGNFSGHAWSENIGWIDFAPVGPYPEAPNNSAHYDSVTGEVSGWAKILSLGNDGWLKLRATASAGVPFPIPFSIPFPLFFGSYAYGVSIDSATGDFSGWAWNYNEDSEAGIGWVDFSGVVLGSGSPVASNLGVSSSYCGSAAQYFSWNYSDPESDNEERFQFRVDNNSDFSSPEVNRDYTGLSNPSPTTNNQTVTIAETPAADQLGYNTTYYWQAKVYDINGSDSGWISGPSFTTESHRYPSINFNWSPTEPSAEEDVLFSDQSTVYGGASKSSWSWTFENGNPGSSSQQNPTIQFTTTGDKDVVLGVTDSDGYTCSQTKTVGVQEVLPDWKEILPW